MLRPRLGQAAICSGLPILAHQAHSANMGTKSRDPGGLVMTDGPKKMVWIYVDTNHYVGHPDHLKVFATPDAADEWFKENDPEGVVFGYEIIE